MAKKASPNIQRIEWIDEKDGLSYFIEPRGPQEVIVSSGDKVVGPAPIPDSLSNLGAAKAEELEAMVKAAVDAREIRRWEAEGGSPPGR